MIPPRGVNSILDKDVHVFFAATNGYDIPGTCYNFVFVLDGLFFRFFCQVRAKALGDDHSLETAIAFVLDNFDKCMSLPRGVNTILAEGNPREGDEDIPACLKHDDSPAVDLLLALAKRYGQCDGICLSR